ncbi:Na(+)/myo-inositol cotransporter 2 [Intoshia linei]|uniref:Na(+)/myo-inositol cotransporter 2 n=1 Tax=Intoshia linei TaxID=1819745 RepID=A0A177B0Q8_9BILA|nr:Na(+)/myo-inositol cotransporter 2 [Intoshia linei]
MMFYILTKISVNIMSGLIFIEVAIGYNSIYSIVFIIIVSFVISLYGGLTSVIFTDCIQTFVMLVGAGIVMIIALIEVKGYKNLHSSYTKLIDDKCYSVPKDAWTMLRPWNSKTMPWLGFLFGQSMASISYWCSDQMMVQRVLASKNISHAKGSTIFAAFLKLTPTFLLVIPGMISRCLYDKIIGCETAETCMLSCGKTTSCSNYAYPFLIMKLLPSGLRGLMLVVLVASLITDLTSIFNSASSLFTCDLYKYIRPKARNRELMVASRIFVVFMVVISVLWVPIIERMQGGEIYMYIQSIAAHISPQMGVMILIGMLWTRANEKGAFYGLMSGLAVGIIRLVLDIVYPEPKCGDLIDVRPAVVKIHYMYMALISSLVTLIVTVIISYLTKEPEKDFLIRTTIWTLDEKSYTKEEIALLKLVKDENKLSESILSEKGNSQDSTTTKNKTIWKRILNCIIGEYVGIKQERKEAAAKYFKTISSINQTKFQKYILNIFAGIVIFMVLVTSDSRLASSISVLF